MNERHKMNIDKNSTIWHCVTIDKPELTPGVNLCRFLEEILAITARNAVTVVLSGVEGGGDPVQGVTRLGCVRMSKQELLKRLKFTNQLDWANFYFFVDVDEQMLRNICGNFSFAEAVSRSTLTVRVIDDSSVDIFTSENEFARNLATQYAPSHMQSALLSEMTFPC
jgi:hypothetical protein